MRRRLSGLILLLPTLLWLAAQLAMTTMLPQAAGAGLYGAGTQVVICSWSGTRIVTIGADGQPIEDDATAAECPLCAQMSGAAPLLPPDTHVVTVVSEPTWIGSGFAGNAPHSRAPPRHYQTRAPPFFASL